MEISPLSPTIGAEVRGVDLNQALTDAQRTMLNSALDEHIVLVIRDQSLEPDAYVAAMRMFGNPAPQNHSAQLLPGRPEIWRIDSSKSVPRHDGQRVPVGASCWHTDHTNQQRPPKITALFAVNLPAEGGDTSFVNAYEMFESLSAESKTEAEALKTITGADTHVPQREEDAESFKVPAVHPLVRTHPRTGRKALYVHPLKMQSIEGMSPEASNAFVDRLLNSTIRPEFCYRHKWRDGDLVLIDNRACLHKAERDYDPAVGRVMHRIIIEGDEAA